MPAERSDGALEVARGQYRAAVADMVRTVGLSNRKRSRAGRHDRRVEHFPWPERSFESSSNQGRSNAS
jgi:hypothetical protein